MHQTFFKIERSDVAIVFGMSQRLVDVKELDALGGIISVNCFQTGNIAKERRSGKAPEYNDSVLSFNIGESKLAARVVEDSRFR